MRLLCVLTGAGDAERNATRRTATGAGLGRPGRDPRAAQTAERHAP